jgi:DNA-directed DNA polymerase III PolC
MFVHLHCHSYYSFLRGTFAPAQLAAKAAGLGMPAVALTDTDGMYGAVEFYQACREAGVKPILGTEIVENGRSAVFLARSRDGWEEICRIITARKLDGGFSLARTVQNSGDGIFILTPAAELIPARPPRGLHLEIDAGMPASVRETVAAEGRRRRVPLAAANDVHFLRPEDRPLAKLLACIRTRRTWSDLPPEAVPPPRAFFLSAAGMEETLGGYPEALAASSRIAEECNVELELGKIHLPRYPLPPGEESRRLLRRLCAEGLRERYRRPSRPVRERLEKELGVIESLSLADYFLFVEEIVRFARGRSIPTLGRGSAANSIVCYLLGITHVEPIRHHLYFERFLSPEREDPPDIDLDFPYHRRDEAIAHIYERYGKDRVAMLSTVIRFRARSGLRAAAAAKGLAPAAVERLTRSLPDFASLQDPDRIRREVPECRGLPWADPSFRSLLRAAARIEDFPRHLSVHPGGVIVAPEPLTRYLALEKAAKGIVVTQPDRRGVRGLGLLKMDILSQRALSVVEDVLKEEARKGRPIDFRSTDPSGDRPTAELLAAGRTIGCFYIESPVMRNLLRRLQVRDFETMTAASSIIRPGVSNTGLSERYIQRRLGKEPVAPIHPLVDPILAETYGVMVYQEQVMRVAIAAAGMTAAAADRFRKCMSKKPGWEEIGKRREGFFRGARANGVGAAAIEELWRQIEGFAAYAFCKAHSASFCLLSYQVAYLKANRPAPFMAALISHRGGFYPTGEYIEEARRMGLAVLNPDVNRSAWEWRTEGEGIRAGMMEVGGLSAATREKIFVERGKVPFSSPEDFLRRVGPRRDEAAALVKSGALDELGEDRRTLAWRLLAGVPAALPLFPAAALPSVPPPRFPVRGEGKREEADPAVLFRGIPLVRSAELAKLQGKEVQFIGRAVTERLTRTAKDGRLMKFLTLEDDAGLFEVVLFPECYARCGRHLSEPGPFYVRGEVQVKDGVAAVICHSLSSITRTDEDIEGERTTNRSRRS